MPRRKPFLPPLTEANVVRAALRAANSVLVTMRAKPSALLTPAVAHQLKCDQRTAAKYIEKYAARIREEQSKLASGGADA